MDLSQIRILPLVVTLYEISFAERLLTVHNPNDRMHYWIGKYQAELWKGK